MLTGQPAGMSGSCLDTRRLGKASSPVAECNSSKSRALRLARAWAWERDALWRLRRTAS
jgi:hypothetical protein